MCHPIYFSLKAAVGDKSIIFADAVFICEQFTQGTAACNVPHGACYHMEVVTAS